MGKAKWIGGILGWAFGGPLGILAGVALGSLYEHLTDNTTTHSEDSNQGERNSFFFSLLVLAAHMIQADGKIMHSEMEYMRRFLRRTFGDIAEQQGNDILLKLYEYRKQQGEAAWRENILQACAEIKSQMPESERLQLIAFLAEIAKADGIIAKVEVDALRQLVVALGLRAELTDEYLSLGGDTLEDAYRVLGLTPDATADEVRRAYRRLVVENHPDKVAHLGEEVKAAATKKLQQITEAKERIDKAMGK